MPRGSTDRSEGSGDIFPISLGYPTRISAQSVNISRREPTAGCPWEGSPPHFAPWPSPRCRWPSPGLPRLPGLPGDVPSCYPEVACQMPPPRPLTRRRLSLPVGYPEIAVFWRHAPRFQLPARHITRRSHPARAIHQATGRPGASDGHRTARHASGARGLCRRDTPPGPRPLQAASPPARGAFPASRLPYIPTDHLTIVSSLAPSGPLILSPPASRQVTRRWSEAPGMTALPHNWRLTTRQTPTQVIPPRDARTLVTPWPGRLPGGADASHYPAITRTSPQPHTWVREHLRARRGPTRLPGDCRRSTCPGQLPHSRPGNPLQWPRAPACPRLVTSIYPAIFRQRRLTAGPSNSPPPSWHARAPDRWESVSQQIVSTGP